MSDTSRRVLLVDPNPEQLAWTASRLRERGLKVSLANGTPMACERARAGRFDVVIAAGELATPGADGMSLLDALALEVGRLPPYLLLVGHDEGGALKESVRRDDIDAIVARVMGVAPARASVEPPGDSVPPSLAGNLASISLIDALRTLSLEKRTGTLSVSTQQGAGEVRLVEGEVVDVVYKNLEGLKALSRMTSEPEGSFSFSPGSAAVVRRIKMPAQELLASCEAEREQSKRLLAELGDLHGKALLAVDGAPERSEGPAAATRGGSTRPDGPQSDPGSDVARAVLSRLRSPATIEQLLDDLPALDSHSLTAVVALDASGRLKRLAHPAERVALATAEQLPLVRAQVAKGRAPGFDEATRLVFAGTPGKIAILTHAVLSLADAAPPAEAPPTLPIPHPMAVVKLGDGVDLELAALPLVPVYAPLWPMALAGAAAVVRLDEAAAAALESACESSHVPIAEAQALVGTLDESNVGQVASLIRAALDASSGQFA
jgi:CheY-like chemotaxis protein